MHKAKSLIPALFAGKKCAETYYFQQLVNINHVKYLIGSKSANIKRKKLKKNKNILIIFFNAVLLHKFQLLSGNNPTPKLVKPPNVH